MPEAALWRCLMGWVKKTSKIRKTGWRKSIIRQRRSLMQTWLDWYIDGYLDTVHRLMAISPNNMKDVFRNVTGKSLARATDLDAARFIVRLSQANPSVLLQGFQRPADRIE